MAETESGADSGGFISQILTGIGTGLSNVASNVLPRWVENELIGQEDSKLFNPTRDDRAELLNVFEALERGGFTDPRLDGQPTAFSGLNMTDGLIFAAIAVVGVILVVRS